MLEIEPFSFSLHPTFATSATVALADLLDWPLPLPPFSTRLPRLKELS